MTAEELAIKIKAECSTGDYEHNGYHCDDLLWEWIKGQGYLELHKELQDVDRWYA